MRIITMKKNGPQVYEECEIINTHDFPKLTEKYN